jgi:hypothetical protein
MLPCAAVERTRTVGDFSILLTSRVNDNSRFFWPARESRIASARSRSRLPLRRGPRKIRQLELHRRFAGRSVRHSPAGAMVESASPFAFRSRRRFQCDRAIATRYESPKARYPTHRPDKSLDRLCSRRLAHMISFIFPAVIE